MGTGSANERAREAREKAGISQKELGEMMGRHRKTVSRMEQPGYPFSISDAKEWARFTGSDPAWIIDGSQVSGQPAPEVVSRILDMIDDFESATKSIKDKEAYDIKVRLFVLAVARELKTLTGDDEETKARVEKMLDQLILDAMKN